ncbi:MAG TPA: DUF3616 domain-containing protein [Verrucomicrobiae bacterium]
MGIGKNICWLGAWLAVASAAAAPIMEVSAPAVYFGMCDASAGVALATNLFAVANDEDNVVRTYRTDRTNGPVQTADLSSFLRVDRKWPETDLEGAAWLGDWIFWIGSHGCNRDGEFRESRHRLFATRLEKTGATLRLAPVGRPYPNLVNDLARDPRLVSFHLAAASRRAPKAPGALNIEGLCATSATNLLIGFRNPVPQGRALLVPLLNPFEVVAGRPANFGDPILLDLGGQGIRDLGYWQGKYVIIAGSYDGAGHSHLFFWKGGAAQPKKAEGVHLKGINPEAVVVYPGNLEAFQLLSDDGTMLFNGVDCKKLASPLQRHFRSVWVSKVNLD